jgi:hypothetical protein
VAFPLPDAPSTIEGVRRLILFLLAIGTVLSGCSSGSSSGPSFRDGEAFAQGQIQQGNPLLVNPKAECDSLVSAGSVPPIDDQGQWEAGCEAALANAHFVGGSTGTG